MRVRTLKKLISGYMYKIAGVLVLFILIILVYVQIFIEKRQALESGAQSLQQIKAVLEENQLELEQIQEEYRQSCLLNAETAARIIQGSPEILDSVEELKELARLVEVDEIHIFDSTGRIFTGTHPQYYDYTFDSGEQMNFFKPMLEDKTLKLVQDITPNTAESKPMQYSAVWSENGEFIVQVGMEPVNVMKATAKNELSYLFSRFRISTEADYYAIHEESGEIVGSTVLETVGMSASEIGFDLERLENETSGFYGRINGKKFFCVFQKADSNYIGWVVEVSILYKSIPATTLLILQSLILVALFLVVAVVRYTDRYVVTEIEDVNEKLKSITDGNLEEYVDIQSSAEFAQLSRYVNSMVKSLLSSSKKLSYVLSKSNIHIGTYEYDSLTGRVHYTEYMPKILSLTPERMEELASRAEAFAEFLEEIQKDAVPGEPGVCRKGERYIRLEEIREDGAVFGVAVDVTAETARRIRIERERDMDVLTGLYSRRGLDRRLEQLFKQPEKLGQSVMIMIDTDNLKRINDTYGHEKGDIYLKKIGEAISKAGTRSRVAARQGGDEFVLFLYGYDSREELENAIREVGDLQDNQFVALSQEVNIPLRFSFGYCIVDGETNFSTLLKEADKKMYQNKTLRKAKMKNKEQK